MKRISTVAMAVGLAAAAMLPAYATSDAEPTNNTCSGGQQAFGGTQVNGHLDAATDSQDHYVIWMTVNDTLTVELRPNANFDLYLYNSVTCTSPVAQSVTAGTSWETVTYPIPQTGWYFVRAQAASGSNSYTISFTVTGQPPKSCQTSTSCSITSPSCAVPTGCTYWIEVIASGTGLVGATFGTTTCAALQNCSATGTRATTQSGTFTDTCQNTSPLATGVTVRCTVRL